MTDRLLVFGGRVYANKPRLFEILDAEPRPAFLLQGGARGADTLAAEWADARGIAILTFQADWKQYGRNAGPIRNQQMIDIGKPDRAIGFPGSLGTMDMLRRLIRAGIDVKEVR